MTTVTTVTGPCPECNNVARHRDGCCYGALAAQLVESQEALNRRDREWCLAFADAVGAGSGLNAPLAPSALKECLELYARTLLSTKGLRDSLFSSGLEFAKKVMTSQTERAKSAITHTDDVLGEFFYAFKAIENCLLTMLKEDPEALGSAALIKIRGINSAALARLAAMAVST